MPLARTMAELLGALVMCDQIGDLRISAFD
jgi:hypothetical protein